jgi:hypothetical protein
MLDVFVRCGFGGCGGRSIGSAATTTAARTTRTAILIAGRFCPAIGCFARILFEVVVQIVDWQRARSRLLCRDGTGNVGGSGPAVIDCFFQPLLFDGCFVRNGGRRGTVTSRSPSVLTA